MMKQIYLENGRKTQKHPIYSVVVCFFPLFFSLVFCGGGFPNPQKQGMSTLKRHHCSGQIAATKNDLTTNGGLV